MKFYPPATGGKSKHISYLIHTRARAQHSPNTCAYLSYLTYISRKYCVRSRFCQVCRSDINSTSQRGNTEPADEIDPLLVAIKTGTSVQRPYDKERAISVYCAETR